MPYYLNLNFSKTLWLIILALFLFFTLTLISLAAVNYDKTITGLTLVGLPVDGIHKNQINRFMANQAEKFGQQKITLAAGRQKWLLTPADFGLQINIEETAANLISTGRGRILPALAQQIKSAVVGQDAPLVYSVDFTKFNQTMSLLASLEIPAQNAALKYDSQNNDFTITAAQTGRIINRADLLAELIKTFNQKNLSIELSTAVQYPLVNEKVIEQIAEEARRLVNNAPYLLQTEDATWRVDKTDLAGWVSALPPADSAAKTELTLDKEKIADFLAPLAASVNREPLDAKLTFEGDRLKFATLSQNGQKLDISTSAQKIAEDILSDKKDISLAIDTIAPAISNQNTQELGLLTLLGQGESNFAGSPNNRRVNIKVGATKLNGFLIRPGEEFSFSANIGDIDAQNGWLPELVIKNKQTIPEFGGGLCQVSTTLFRAAIKAGLKIIERHPHAYPVRYYDPPGFDATVYPPKPDLKFLNDTPGHILLQNRIQGNKLIFEIYGTDDGREIKIKGPFTTQKNSDGSLKTILTQEIWRHGQIAATNIFRSAYRSPALFPVATPTPTPTPTPSPTAAPTPAN